MKLNEALTQLDELERTLRAYRHAIGVMNYDGETAASRNSAAGRGETLATLGAVEHGLLTAPQTRETIDTILSERGALPLREVRRAEVLKERVDELCLVPVDAYKAYQRLLAEAGAVWHAAKPANDHASFAPFLDRIVDYNRRLAERKDASKPAYDVLLDTYEKGTSMAMLDPFFEALRESLTPLVKAVGGRPRPDAPFMHAACPVHEQRAFTDRLMALLGIDRDDCSVGETEHPFTDAYGRHDVRITTHYHVAHVTWSMYSVIHEGGHALYELGVDDALQGTVLAGGASMALHESQSRFYENLIGRSRPFCEALLPIMRECFPEQTRGLDAETLYRCVNLSEPSLVRTEADELTYSMHVMVRYELEKRMMAGDLRAADLPAAWNGMYRRYLGVDVPDDRRGYLQDSHWSAGLLGYFPSYALGSAYGAQMLRAMEADIDVWDGVGRGDLSAVTGWLRERIHRHGMLLTPGQVFESACGAPFDPKYYIDYLTDKYSALYGL